MNYEGATVSVVNWDKYNPRMNAKRPNWFRVENTLATGPGFHELDCEQKWLWIVILSLISQKNGEPIEWKSSYVQALTGIKPKKQYETLEIFERFVRLHVSRKVSVRDSHATDGRTDETDGQDIGQTEKKPAAPSAPALPHLVKVWNDHRGSLPEVKGCSGTRRRLAEARWRDNPSTEYWAEIVARIARSPFCSGDNERGWRASFDFLIRPETQHKVLEGKYDASHTGKPQAWVDPEIARMRQRAAEEDSYGQP